MSTPVAEFREVVKDYPVGLLRREKLRAVDAVNLKIEPGQIFGLLGPNRAGKTTLVKLLLSLCKPTSGQVFRFGKPTTERSTLIKVGYVHENHAFPRYLSASALLEYYGAMSLLSEPRVRARMPELLELVGLEDRANEPISRFSKGMIQRLGVAQALINDPDLLVLDEPSEGLDLSGRTMVFDVADKLRKEGKTVLLISHVLPEVERVCDSIAVIRSGTIVYDGSIKKLTEGPEGNQGSSLEEAVRKFYEPR
ncbi:MAG: ABC transporter ATP-binding protein [Gemmataceae bacterium]